MSCGVGDNARRCIPVVCCEKPCHDRRVGRIYEDGSSFISCAGYISASGCCLSGPSLCGGDLEGRYAAARYATCAEAGSTVRQRQRTRTSRNSCAGSQDRQNCFANYPSIRTKTCHYSCTSETAVKCLRQYVWWCSFAGAA